MILYSLQSLCNSSSVIYIFIMARRAGKKFGLLLKQKGSSFKILLPPPPRAADPPFPSHVTNCNHFHPYFWTPPPWLRSLWTAPKPLEWSTCLFLQLYQFPSFYAHKNHWSKSTLERQDTVVVYQNFKFLVRIWGICQ